MWALQRISLPTTIQVKLPCSLRSGTLNEGVVAAECVVWGEFQLLCYHDGRPWHEGNGWCESNVYGLQRATLSFDKDEGFAIKEIRHPSDPNNPGFLDVNKMIVILFAGQELELNLLKKQ